MLADDVSLAGVEEVYKVIVNIVNKGGNYREEKGVTMDAHSMDRVDAAVRLRPES